MPESAGATQPDAGQAVQPPLPPSRQTVRDATPADAGRLAEINALTWTTAYAGVVPAEYLGTMTAQLLRERWSDRLAEDPTERITLVVAVDGVLAGYAIGGPYRVQQDADAVEDTTHWGELYALYTDPAFQGRGGGTAVHDALLERLASRGFTAAALWALRDNARSRRWYVARGWRADGARSQWHGAGEPLEEIRMVRPLDNRSRLEALASSQPARPTSYSTGRSHDDDDDEAHRLSGRGGGASVGADWRGGWPSSGGSRLRWCSHCQQH